jgi:hypothetical protein
VKHAVLAGIAVLLAAGLVPRAHANQFDALLLPDAGRSEMQITAFREVELSYPADNVVAKALDGRSGRYEFSLDSTSEDMKAIVEKINNTIRREQQSTLVIENATLHYVATYDGHPEGADLFYKVDIKASISGYVLQKEDDDEPAIVDLDWRNFAVRGSLTVSTEHGALDINSPAGALRLAAPELAEKLLDSDAREVMEDPILDFGRFDLPMEKWHFLFDVTGEQLKNYDVFVPGEGRTVSIHSIGESSFREGTYKPKVSEATAIVDGVKVGVRASTPPPSGQITIAGYSCVQEKGGTEFAIVRSTAHGRPRTGFPLQVLMVFAGMVGAIALFVLYKARS